MALQGLIVFFPFFSVFFSVLFFFPPIISYYFLLLLHLFQLSLLLHSISEHVKY